jgi:3-hydroxy-3-methylglutaryl CoA synthase/uncharacterized OB-fold protein
MACGILSWGAYIPKRRLERSAIAAAHAWMAPSLKNLGKGMRAYCNWDEDAVTMAVEAARLCIEGRARETIGQISVASTTAPFADLQASAIAAAALRLPSTCGTLDFAGSQRVGVSALAEGLRPAGIDKLIIASERPNAKPASTQEMQYGAGAAAFTTGEGDVAAELIGSATRMALFVDHFRATGATHDYYWEERWIRDEGFLKIGASTVSEALAACGAEAASVDHFIFTAAGRGAGAVVAKACSIKFEAVADVLDLECGYTGAAHSLLMLADVLDRATPGQIIVVAGFGQGCEVLVFRTTDAITGLRPRLSVAAQLQSGIVDGAYLRLASFYGEIAPDFGMRAERDTKTALTEQYRSADQIYGFVAGKCGACGTVQFPQLSYCVECQAPANGFEDLSLAPEKARVLTYTADSLAYHPAPPFYVGFAQFENGARLLMEFVDVDPDRFDVGTPLEMRFRIKERDTQRGYDRYFWKATPVL